MLTGSFEDFAGVVDRPRDLVEEGGSFWRKDEPVRSEAGLVIKGGMWAHQLAWWNLPNFIKALVGGYGAGKTMILGKRIISLALQNAPVPVATVSPTFPLARQTIIPTIKQLLSGKQGLLGKGLYWKYNETAHEFKIRYHGREAKIICYSGDKPDALRGPNLGAAGIDEPFIMDEAVFIQMIARVRHPDAVLQEILLTGTPEQLNWGFDLCMGQTQDRHDVGHVRASTRANLALRPDYVQRLLGALSGKAAEAYVEGEFRNLASGMVYYAFSDANVVKLPLPDGVELGCGMDFNVNPFAFCVFWKVGSHIHFFKEYELPNADTEYACQVLREDFNDRLQTIYPDASGHNRHTSAPGGKSDFWYIKQAGFEISAPNTNPHVKDRYNAVNGKLKPAKAILGMDGKQLTPTLTIDPSCKRLIKCLSTYSHELKNKQEGMSHLLDSFGYPIHRLFPISRELIVQSRIEGA